MPYDPRAVANYFLDLASVDGESISPLKLQKLLYFGHGWHLAITGEPLLSERIRAWKYGPVVESIYYQFRRFGNRPITTRAGELDTGPDGWFEVMVVELPDGEEHEETRAVLQ